MLLKPVLHGGPLIGVPIPCYHRLQHDHLQPQALPVSTDLLLALALPSAQQCVGLAFSTDVAVMPALVWCSACTTATSAIMFHQ